LPPIYDLFFFPSVLLPVGLLSGELLLFSLFEAAFESDPVSDLESDLLPPSLAVEGLSASARFLYESLR
jgi:hypothetical protein